MRVTGGGGLRDGRDEAALSYPKPMRKELPSAQKALCMAADSDAISKSRISGKSQPGAVSSLRFIQIHVPVGSACHRGHRSEQDAPQGDPQQWERQRKDGKRRHGIWRLWKVGARGQTWSAWQ